jgi:hypothetical protein
MLGTILDASCSVRIFSFWIFLPTILDRVVALHRRALLLADAVVVEVAAGLKCKEGNDEAIDDQSKFNNLNVTKMVNVPRMFTSV